MKQKILWWIRDRNALLVIVILSVLSPSGAMTYGPMALLMMQEGWKIHVIITVVLQFVVQLVSMSCSLFIFLQWGYKKVVLFGIAGWMAGDLLAVTGAEMKWLSFFYLSSIATSSCGSFAVVALTAIWQKRRQSADVETLDTYMEFTKLTLKPLMLGVGFFLIQHFLLLWGVIPAGLKLILLLLAFKIKDVQPTATKKETRKVTLRELVHDPAVHIIFSGLGVVMALRAYDTVIPLSQIAIWAVTAVGWGYVASRLLIDWMSKRHPEWFHQLLMATRVAVILGLVITWAGLRNGNAVLIWAATPLIAFGASGELLTNRSAKPLTSGEVYAVANKTNESVALLGYVLGSFGMWMGFGTVLLIPIALTSLSLLGNFVPQVIRRSKVS